METCAGNIQAQCPGSMYLKCTELQVHWFNVADLSGLLSIKLRPGKVSLVVFCYHSPPLCSRCINETDRKNSMLQVVPFVLALRTSATMMHNWTEIKIGWTK